MSKEKVRQIGVAPTEPTVIYPESDGKPMAETDLHRKLMTTLIETLENYFRQRGDVYVSGDLLLYYEEGNPRKSVAPDVFVVFGVEKKLHRTYLMWEEGKGPDFVVELASKNTYRHDLAGKKDLYAQVLGVKEYYIHDPEGLYLQPSLMGYRLENGVYSDIQSVDGLFHSETLGLSLGEDAGTLKLYNPETENWVLTPAEEAEARAIDAEARVRQESLARQQAEEELARVRAELEQLRTNT